MTDQEWKAVIANRGIKMRLKRSMAANIAATPQTEQLSTNEDLSPSISSGTVMLSVPALSPVSNEQLPLEEDDANPDPKKLRNRPRLSDLEPKYQELALTTFPEYRSMLATQCPYPNAAEDHVMAGTVLKHASTTMNLQVEDDRVHRIIIALVRYFNYLQVIMPSHFIPV